MDFNIDPKDVIDLAAQKLADQVLDQYDDLASLAEMRIKETIASVISDEMRVSMAKTVDDKLQSEMEKILQHKIVPVDIWGEATGEPSTLREQIHKRALEYWEESVEPDKNKRGRYRKTSYGGTPRHKLVFQDVAQKAFEEAMRANIAEMVKSFRDAMRKDMARKVEEHIDKIISNRVIGK